MQLNQLNFFKLMYLFILIFPGEILPIVKLTITVDGVHFETINLGTKRDEFEHTAVFFNIESISYGVQDLVYTR